MKFLLSFLLTLLAGHAAAQTPRLVVPIGNAMAARALAFSPDGQYALTGGGGTSAAAKMWDRQGREIQSFTDTSVGAVVAFSPDGRSILTGNGREAKLWDWQGRAIQSFKGADFAVFSPDGQRVLVWDQLSSVVRLINVQGRKLGSFKLATQSVSFLVFSPDGQRLLSGDFETTHLWDLQGRTIRSFAGGDAAAFSPDGKTILTVQRDTIRLWDLAGRRLQAFPGRSPAIFSPDGKTVLSAAAGIGGTGITLRDLAGRAIQTFNGHNKPAIALAFSRDGKTILTSSADKTVLLWDVQGHILQSFGGHSNDVRFAAVSPDGKYVATRGLTGNQAQLWNLEGPEIHALDGRINSIGFLPDGKTILGADNNKTVTVWDLQGHAIQSIRAFAGAKSPATTGTAEGPEPRVAAGGLPDQVNQVVVSPDGQRVLTTSSYGTVKLWDWKGAEIKTFHPYDQRSLPAITFSTDGQIVLSTQNARTYEIKLWDAQGKELLAFQDKGLDYVRSLGFSPDKKTVLGCRIGSHTAELWDLSGRSIQSFAGHRLYISSVAFSPAGPGDPAGGQRVLTGSMDNTAKLWDLKGTELKTFKGHTAPIHSVAFLNLGQQVLTASGVQDPG